MASWKRFLTPFTKPVKESILEITKEYSDAKSEVISHRRGSSDAGITAKPPGSVITQDTREQSSKHQHKVSCGYRENQQNVKEESSILCRICEEEVPTSCAEDHSECSC